MIERTGGCLCGSVRYRARVDTELGACHCSMCRRFSGGIFLGVKAEAFEVSGDTLEVYASSDWAERGFCARCGASLFFRVTVEGPYQGELHLAAGTLDDFEGLSLETEVFIDQKPAAYALAGPTRQMTEADILAMVEDGGTPP